MVVGALRLMIEGERGRGEQERERATERRRHILKTNQKKQKLKQTQNIIFINQQPKETIKKKRHIDAKSPFEGTPGPWSDGTERTWFW